MAKNKHIKKIFEDFMMSEPKKAPTKTPTKTPTRTPRRGPSPIRRDKPSVKPKPMATAEEVYDRFIKELREADGEIKFDLKFLASKYKMTESQVVKGFAQYVYEASLEDNPGIPGEGEGDESDKYLRDIERRGQEMQRDVQQRYGRKIPQFMSTVQAVQRLQAGKERELEELAEAAIREMYGSILDGVKLDIKFPEQGELKGEMEEVDMDPPEMEEIEDENVKKEIHKRKIANNITQGEAKNTKLILNMPFIADGLREIFGEEDGNKMVELLTEITNIASFFDWNIPLEVQKQMWQTREGFAGTVSVDWEEDEDEQAEKTAEDIIANLESGEDILDQGDELEELFNETKPVIKARGLDFAMLIHETVKGIYQLISAMGIPEDERVANLVIMNTDNLAGELEDLRYGPYIASDLNNFIMNFSEANDIDNLKEHFFGKLMQLPADDFLELIRLILMEDDRAEDMAQEIIDEISQEIRDWQVDGISSYGDDEDDGDFEVDDYGKPTPSPLQSDDDSYSQMSDREIRELIDDALDAGNMEEVRRLAKYLKESLNRRYENELNESKFSFISSYNRFKKKESYLINENLTDGARLYVKLKAEEAGFDYDNLTEEEIKRLENSKEWLDLRNLLERGKRPGDATTFVKFLLLQGASMEDLTNLINDLSDQSVKAILKDLPMQVPQYAKIEAAEGETPGYERLMDDIATAKSSQIGKWVVRSLSNKAATRDYSGTPIPGATPFNQKEAFNQLPKEKQDEIIDLAAQLSKLDESGEVVKSFKKRISKWGSMEELKEQLENRIKGFSSGLNGALEKVDRLDSAANTIWTGDNKAIFVFRSPQALNSLCSIAEWCINPREGGSSSFYNYASGGNVQYVGIDYNLSPSDANHIIGFTVKPDGSIRAAHDRRNASMVNYGHRAGQGNNRNPLDGNIEAFLDFFGVPEADKKEIVDALPMESRLMKELGPIFQNMQNIRNLDQHVLKLISNTEYRANKASFTDEEFTRTHVDRLRDSLIVGLIRNAENEEVLENARTIVFDRFKEKGCTNIEAAKHFRAIFGEDLPTSVIDDVLKANAKRRDALVRFPMELKRKSAAERQKLEQVLSQKGQSISSTLRMSEIMVKNVDQASTYIESLKNNN